MRLLRVFVSFVLAATVLVAVPALSAPSQASAASLTPSSKQPTSNTAALKTTYKAPTGALYVATNGSDKNPGTKRKPLKTLAKAMKLVKANGTIVVRGGVHRQGAARNANHYQVGGSYYYTGIPRGVTIQAYPGETVWFDGTVKVPTKSWKKVKKGHYSIAWSTPDFCAQGYYRHSPTKQGNQGPCSYPDSVGGNASLGDPQMVFRDGKQLKQVSSLAKLTKSNQFYYDWPEKRLHIRFKPKGNSVSVTKYAQAMALFQPENLTIKGIGFRRYASNQYANATAGAVLINGGRNVVIERSVFTENAGIGLQAWQTANLRITRSRLVSNGFNGFAYDGSWLARSKGNAVKDNLAIEYSVLDGNNTDRYGVNCTWACAAAGAKVTGTSGITLKYSSFSRNGGGRASGFWCDLGCDGLAAYGNVFHDNDRHGLVYEISEDAVIASNQISDNGWQSTANGGGYGLYLGSARVRVYHNTIVGNRSGIGLYDDPRSPRSNTGGFAADRLGADTVDVELVNNVVAGGDARTGRLVAIAGGDLKHAGNTTATHMIKRLASNTYHLGKAKYWLVWTEVGGAKSEVYRSVAAFERAKGHEVDSTIGPNVLSKSSLGVYSVKPKSSAHRSAAALPDDIAALMGVDKSGHNRGVIRLS